MSDIIRLLPDSVANQIAAGEVIQRPASVIKELVENAVDAGASEIRIQVRDAGKTLIQVADNGIGMSDTDARMAFERHATSKIRQTSDLFTLRSMGFRGEALPSICAISEVELKTRSKESSVGTHLVIEGSRVVNQEPAACEQGTVISVKRLFYNVPARRKFLKSDNVELSNIMREFERLALVNHKLRMSIDTGTRKIELRPGTFRQRIEEIWKNVLNSSHLLPVEIDTSLVKVEGYISRPEFARRRNPLQYLIVNGRNMRHPYFHKAILNCYESLIAPGTQPCYFLVFTVDPETIDVNIHPTKNEIKFEHEQEIWPLLASAVKTSLGKFAAVPSIDFSVDALPVHPLAQGEEAPAPADNFDPDYNPFTEGRKAVSEAYRPTRVDSNWDKLYAGFERQGRTETTPTGVPAQDMTDGSGSLLDGMEAPAQPSAICMQFGMKYIVTSSREGLLLIDQHRAHVTILYNEYMRRSGAMEMVSQTVMFPETVTFDASQQAALQEVEDDLKGMGFEIEYDSGTEWRITRIPAMLSQSEVKDTILRILDSVTEDSANYGSDGRVELPLREKIMLIMARAASIKRGVKLSQRDMEDLIGRLFSLPEPSLTPNGNPVFTVLTEASIAKMLG